MEFKKTTEEDMAYVRMNPYEVAVKGYNQTQTPEENTYTAIFESEIVAVFGILIRWPGYCLCWLMLTDRCRKRGIYGLIALGAIQKKFEELLEDNNILRAEANIRPDFDAAIKMVEFLGFEREGLMKCQLPDGGDAFLYAKIRKAT
jgi:RimJ/RimL family protein N-acetyltransferase